MLKKNLSLSSLLLKTDKAFEYVFEKGKKYYFDYGIIYLVEFSDSEEFKFAVIVSKECGNAVKRNRLKRLTKEFFRLNQKIFKSMKLILIFKKKPFFKGYKDVEIFFKNFFKNKNIIKVDN